MLTEMEPVTVLGVLEYDGLICIQSGVAHTTDRFQSSMAAAEKARRARHHLDLRERISHAMHGLYGKYLSEAEMLTLVDAMLPIAEADGDPRPAPARTSRRQA